MPGNEKNARLAGHSAAVQLLVQGMEIQGDLMTELRTLQIQLAQKDAEIERLKRGNLKVVANEES